jgi:YegS/Rv2252/BmrU family lipid kinase
MENKEKIWFIINPISGVGKQKRVESSIDSFLDKDIFSYCIYYTKYAHHATAISLRAALEGIDIVAVVGGDGSINDCVIGLVGTKVRLAIIPTGSGNGLARALKIPLNINDAIKALNLRNSLTIDTIRINDRIYASIAGIGFDALVAREFAKSKTRGFNSYLQLVTMYYPLYKSQRYLLEIDGQSLETEALFICFANSNQFGYNAAVAPNASLIDGLIDVICVRKIPIVLLPFVANLLFTKKFDTSMFVKAYKAKQVKIISADKTLFNIDGESTEMEGDVCLDILPKSLNVIIPKENEKAKSKTNRSSLFHQ